VTKAVAYLAQLAKSRKLLSFSQNYKLSYVYLWQLKTPKTDSKGRPSRDPETGKVIYRRTPSFKIINRLKDVIPTEYWYEEAAESPGEEYTSRSKRLTPIRTSSMHLWLLPDDPFCGVVSPYDCDPELSEHSRRFSSSTLPKIILDFSF
jgi:hypothetical protein